MNSRFEAIFMRALDDKIGFESKNLIAGMGIDTIEKYREQVGVIRGLHLVRDLWDVAKSETDKERL
jgi:hypothetical protein